MIKKYDDEEQSPYGNQINIHMRWISNEGIYNPEYLVLYI